MSRKIDFPTPHLLQKIDRYLLLNKPAIWSSRIHVVLFYGLALLAALVFHALIRPISSVHLPNPDHQFLLAAVPSLLAFGPFAYHISIYNVEKSFGEKARFFGLKQQMSLLVCVVLLGAIPFTYASIVTDRIANLRTDQELVADVQALNEGDVYFPDYAYVFKDNVKRDGSYNFHMHKYRLYAFVYTPHFKVSQSAVQLKSIHNNPSLERYERVAYAERFIETFNRYSKRQIEQSPERAFMAFSDGKVPVKDLKKDKLKVEDQLQRIIDAKSGAFVFQETKSVKQLGLFMLAISMLLLLFLKMHIKDFSLGMFVGSLAGILISGGADWVADVFSISAGKILFPLLITFLLVCLGTISGKLLTKISNSWKSILLMWVSFIIPLLPLLAVSTEGYIYEQTAYTLLFMGFGVLLLAWHIYLNPKFSFFLSKPSSR